MRGADVPLDLLRLIISFSSEEHAVLAWSRVDKRSRRHVQDLLARRYRAAGGAQELLDAGRTTVSCPHRRKLEHTFTYGRRPASEDGVVSVDVHLCRFCFSYGILRFLKAYGHLPHLRYQGAHFVDVVAQLCLRPELLAGWLTNPYRQRLAGLSLPRVFKCCFYDLHRDLLDHLRKILRKAPREEE